MKLPQTLLLLQLLLLAVVRGHNITKNSLPAHSMSRNFKDFSASTQTTLQPIVERVFSRRRRFLLLPKGGALKFTVSLSKRLLAMYPRGFNMGIEAAVYFPAFTTRMDLLPKRFRVPTTTTRKPSGPTEPLLVYIPGSELRYKAKPAPKPSPTKLHRVDDFPAQWLKYSEPGNAGEGHKQLYRFPQTDLHGLSSKKWWQSANGRHSTWSKRLRSAEDADCDAEESLSRGRVDFADLEPYEKNWRHFHGHRDRRQLFHGFEGLSKVLGIDMKACILRTICECKRLLLPPGHSMMHDMLRVVFTVPTTRGLSDDYSETMRADYESCEERFRLKCPVSLIQTFLSPVQ